jgi:anthranilate/para-aminobenzoate synthase component II
VEEPLPKTLKLTAFTIEGEVMGIRHRDYPTFGVQFHPESILTSEGKRLLENFLAYGPQDVGNGGKNGH